MDGQHEIAARRPVIRNRRGLWVKANPAGRSETSNDPGWAQPESKPSPVHIYQGSQGTLENALINQT